MWPRNLKDKGSPTDLGDLAMVLGPEDDSGADDGESLDMGAVHTGSAPEQREEVVSIDGHPIEMLGIMSKHRALAHARPESIVRAATPR